MRLTTRSMTDASELSLQLDSTLQELPVWELEIEQHLPGNTLLRLFEQEPLLPGIILIQNQEFVGMISRRRFFEYMSRPYSLGLFSLRPIANLYTFLQTQLCIFSEDTLIVAANQLALKRSPELVYEPILVKSKSGNYGIVDFHQLLLANAQIHALTLTQLQRVEEQSQLAKAGFRDLKQNYSRLLQNEKMAALGQLVAGIAHEVNNPINFIAGNLVHATNYIHDLLNVISLYRQHYPEAVAEIETAIAQTDLDFITEDIPKLLTSMQTGCERIEEIVRSLRNFSRLDESARKTVNIHEGIDSTLLILHSRLKNHKTDQSISIIKEYGNLPPVDCYPGLLNQVFMNLLANAIDALEAGIGNGELAVGKESHCITESGLSNGKRLRPQILIQTTITDEQQVMIRIADNGPGIPEDVQQRMFDPFFTTKPVGQGTGLGLSICYQIIVEKHGGQLSCVSTVGQGTELIIKLPVTALR
ncbi:MULTISPECIES: sensor histidine kinase [unclassified Anabaena]|uniref:sensor histidine kinase n=1 Tax=unclassified Anabaena TaxID=2619674 RepID=UPI00082BEA45|nr:MULTISPECIES: ATP-binding protein [unclassified Anabaena]